MAKKEKPLTRADVAAFVDVVITCVANAHGLPDDKRAQYEAAKRQFLEPTES